jgi:hypothetical protein
LPKEQGQKQIPAQLIPEIMDFLDKMRQQMHRQALHGLIRQPDESRETFSRKVVITFSVILPSVLRIPRAAFAKTPSPEGAWGLLSLSQRSEQRVDDTRTWREWKLEATSAIQ